MNPTSNDNSQSIRITISKEAYTQENEQVQEKVSQIVRSSSPGDYFIGISGRTITVKSPPFKFDDQNPGGSGGMYFPDDHFKKPKKGPFDKYDPDNDELKPPSNDDNYFV